VEENIAAKNIATESAKKKKRKKNFFFRERLTGAKISLRIIAG